jgi:hypothetical protein
MKWIKRFSLFLAGLWAFLALASLYSVYLVRGTPRWYVAPRLSQDQLLAAANESDQKLASLLSYANDIAAAGRRKVLTGKETPIAPMTIAFNEVEANAFLIKWQGAFAGSLGSRIGRFWRDGRLVLLDKRLVIAGTIQDIAFLRNTIATAEFSPQLDGHGQLWPDLEHIYSGRLPLPLVLLGRPAAKLRQALEAGLPNWNRMARIGPDGLANRHVVDVVWARLILAALDDSSTDAVLLLPSNLADLNHAVPVRLMDLELSEQTLKLTFRPLTDNELSRLAAEIGSAKEP